MEAVYYVITEKEAIEEVETIKERVEKNWRVLAKKYGLGRNAILLMEPAFDMRYKK